MRMVAGRAHHRARDVAVGARPSRPAPGLLGPPAPHRVAVPAKDRAQSHRPLEPDVPGAADECERRGRKGPIDSRQANPAWLPALENGALVAQ